MNYFTVWARGQNSLWYEAGKLEFGSGSFAFRYMDAWLANSWTYSLDPVHLPLAPAIYYARNQQELLPLFKQLLPQGWAAELFAVRQKASANRTLISQFKQLPESLNSVRLTLAGAQLNELILPSWEEMELYCQMAKTQSPQDWPIARYLAVLSGGCWQGSRPKITLQGAPNLWLAKWQIAGDKINWPQVEYASMQLMQQAGFSVPSRHLIPLENSVWVYLIERFDQHKQAPCYFVPASVLLNPQQSMANNFDAREDPTSYIAFARCLRKYSSQAKTDLIDLFRRMLANLLLNNTQDTLSKLGLVYTIKTQQWRLSPCFGIRPSIEASGLHSMAMGSEGRIGSLKNALSLAKEFGLNSAQAEAILAELKEALAAWNEVFDHCGVSGIDRQLIGSALKYF
ncbi:MAG TPA: HipA domain-containing protein [Cellvibrionaceae bacterium]